MRDRLPEQNREPLIEAVRVFSFSTPLFFQKQAFHKLGIWSGHLAESESYLDFPPKVELLECVRFSGLPPSVSLSRPGDGAKMLYCLSSAIYARFRGRLAILMFQIAGDKSAIEGVAGTGGINCFAYIYLWGWNLKPI